MFDIESFTNEIDKVLASQGKVPAIKALRSATGMDLKDSKYAVDSLATNGRFSEEYKRQIIVAHIGKAPVLGVTWHFITMRGDKFEATGLTEAAAHAIMSILNKTESYGEWA